MRAERARFGGTAPHKFGPSPCICPPWILRCMSFCSPTSSAVWVCPCLGRLSLPLLPAEEWGGTPRSNEACPVKRIPAFPEAYATVRDSRGRTVRCTSSTSGPWYGQTTTRLRRVEAIKDLFQTYFKAWSVSLKVSLRQFPTKWLIKCICMHIRADISWALRIHTDIQTITQIHTDTCI